MGAEDVDEEEEKLRRHMPVYLRDCLKGMRSSDDAVRYEASFRAAETLIRSNPGELREVFCWSAPNIGRGLSALPSRPLPSGGR